MVSDNFSDFLRKLLQKYFIGLGPADIESIFGKSQPLIGLQLPRVNSIEKLCSKFTHKLL